MFLIMLIYDRMSDLTIYPMQDNFETTLSQSWNGAVGTIYVNDIPDATLPADTYTYVVINPGQTNMQVARTSWWSDSPTNSFTIDSIVVNKWPWLAYSATSHSSNATVRFSNNYQFREDIKTAINSKLDDDWWAVSDFDLTVSWTSFRFRNDGWVMKFRDSENIEVSLSDLAETWSDQKVAVSSWDTTPWLLDGKLWAWDWISKSVWSAGWDETLDVSVDLTDTNTFVSTSSWATDSGKSTVLNSSWKIDNFVSSATSSTKWIVEMATDIEALAGTDETRYVNSKQLEDNILYKWEVISIASDTLQSSADTERSSYWTDSDTKYKQMTVGFNWTIRVKVDWKATFNRLNDDWTVSIYVNWSSVAYIRVDEDTWLYETLSVDTNVNVWDTVEIWLDADSTVRPIYCKNFRIYYDLDYREITVDTD